MATATELEESGPTPAAAAEPAAVLLFFTAARSGPCRRVESLVSWLYVRRRKQVRLCQVDVEEHPDVAGRFGVEAVPALFLVKGGCVVVRLDGMFTGRRLDDAIMPHLRP